MFNPASSGCCVQNTSRIQHEDVRAKSSISAMRPPYYPFLEERAILGVIDAAVVGAKHVSNPDSIIKKVVPHLFILGIFLFFAQVRTAPPTTPSPSRSGHRST